MTAGFAGDATHSGSSASTGFAINKLPTTLTISGGGSTALSAGVDTGISATLLNGSVGLPQKSVAFVLTPTGGGTALIQTRITNLNGKASLGIVGQLAPGTYSVAAFFGGAVGAHVTLPADPVYVGSLSASVALTIKVNQLTSGTTTCNSFFAGTGAGVTVPAGAVCTLLPGTKVTGNVVAQQGGTFVDQGATISGNLQATNAVAITVTGGTVGGNLQATSVGSITVTGGGTINGNLQVTGVAFQPAGSDNSLCNTKVNGNVQVSGLGVAIGHRQPRRMRRRTGPDRRWQPAGAEQRRQVADRRQHRQGEHPGAEQHRRRQSDEQQRRRELPAREQRPEDRGRDEHRARQQLLQRDRLRRYRAARCSGAARGRAPSARFRPAPPDRSASGAGSR